MPSQKSNCDQTQNCEKKKNIKLWQNPKTQIGTKLTKKIKLWQNLRTEIGTKLKNSNCDKIQKLKFGQTSKLWPAFCDLAMFLFPLLQIGGASRWKVCYQWGIPCWFFVRKQSNWTTKWDFWCNYTTLWCKRTTNCWSLLIYDVKSVSRHEDRRL